MKIAVYGTIGKRTTRMPDITMGARSGGGRQAFRDDTGAN